MTAWEYELYLLVLIVSLTSSLRSLVRHTDSTRRHLLYGKQKYIIPEGYIYGNGAANMSFA